MLADVYLMPLRPYKEVVRDTEVIVEHSRGSTSYSYKLVTDKREYSITGDLFAILAEGDTVHLYKSVLTTAPVEIEVEKGEWIYRYRVAFNRVRLGLVFTPLVLTGIIVMLIVYRKLKMEKGKRNLTFLLLICTTLLFIYHMDWPLFDW